MKPSLGRIVHVEIAHPPGVYAAIITGVVEDNEMILASCFMPNGSLHADSFTHNEDGGPNTWRWPPKVR